MLVADAVVVVFTEMGMGGDRRAGLSGESGESGAEVDSDAGGVAVVWTVAAVVEFVAVRVCLNLSSISSFRFLFSTLDIQCWTPSAAAVCVSDCSR